MAGIASFLSDQFTLLPQVGRIAPSVEMEGKKLDRREAEKIR
jgi:hypothetical protein